MSKPRIKTGDAVARAVEVVCRVPDQHRHFTASSADLSRVHRIHDGLLEELLGHGLPCRGKGGNRRFDPLDAANIGLQLNLPSPHRVAMRWWRGALIAGEAHPAQVHTMRISPSDRDHRSAAGGSYSLDRRLATAAVPGSISEPTPGTYTLRARLPRARRAFGTGFIPLIDQILGIRFHLIPHSLQWDLGFLAETGLADCKLATHFLVSQAKQLGLPVRRAEGLFVGVPYAMWHAWVEFGVDEEWVAADPFLLNALGAWGIVDPRQWPPTRSPHCVLWRLDSGYFPLLRDAGHAVPTVVAVVSSEPGRIR